MAVVSLTKQAPFVKALTFMTISLDKVTWSVRSDRWRIVEHLCWLVIARTGSQCWWSVHSCSGIWRHKVPWCVYIRTSSWTPFNTTFKVIFAVDACQRSFMALKIHVIWVKNWASVSKRGTPFGWSDCNVAVNRWVSIFNLVFETCLYLQLFHI